MRLRFGLIVVVAVLLSGIARAEFPEQPYPLVNYQNIERTDPPQQIHLARVTVMHRDARVRVVPGGDDPDGRGPAQTTLAYPTKVADREGFDVVINGDFYGSVQSDSLPEGVKGFIVTGAAMTDGRRWATPKNPRPMLIVNAMNRPAILIGTAPPAHARQAVGGSHVLLQGGRNVAPPPEETPFSRGPHPRTAVGIADNGRTMLLVVVDGRRRDATGMSLTDLADLMLELGAREAINLDGGGSSMLGIRHPETGEMTILNRPSDGRERPVANMLGIRVQSRDAKPAEAESTE